MGQLIEYYIPPTFIFVQAKWMPADARGKVIEFRRRVAVKADAQPSPSVPLTNWIISAPPRF